MAIWRPLLLSIGLSIVVSIGLSVGLSIGWALAWPAPAVAQNPPPDNADAVDALATWRRLQVSRAAVRDQIELCDGDAERFQQISGELQPDDQADAEEWKDWGALVGDTARELESCLRAYKMQIGLLRADHDALAGMMPAVRGAKKMSLSPKQLGEVTKAADESGAEIATADKHAGILADNADKSAAAALQLLRRKGVAGPDKLPAFRKLL